MTSPWERQPFDSDESFFWFTAYRDATPPRRLDRVRTSKPGTITPPIQNLLTMATEGHWRERVAAWDDHLDAHRREEQETAASVSGKDIAAQHARLLQESAELVTREMDKLLKTAMSTDAETIKVRDLVALQDQVIKLGRLTRGESTENVATDMDLSHLTVEELRELQRLRDKARKK